jgi:hypothetical protein
VILTEETDWIGSQLTAQAVPPDEHPWLESTGCTASYRRLRQGIRDYYRRNYPLTGAARHDMICCSTPATVRSAASVTNREWRWQC